MQSLLFAFLDELLFKFHTEMLVCTQLRITKLDRKAWKLTAEGWVGKDAVAAVVRLGSGLMGAWEGELATP